MGLKKYNIDKRERDPLFIINQNLLLDFTTSFNRKSRTPFLNFNNVESLLLLILICIFFLFILSTDPYEITEVKQ